MNVENERTFTEEGRSVLELTVNGTVVRWIAGDYKVLYLRTYGIAYLGSEFPGGAQVEVEMDGAKRILRGYTADPAVVEPVIAFTRSWMRTF